MFSASSFRNGGEGQGYSEKIHGFWRISELGWFYRARLHVSTEFLRLPTLVLEWDFRIGRKQTKASGRKHSKTTLLLSGREHAHEAERELDLKRAEDDVPLPSVLFKRDLALKFF